MATNRAFTAAFRTQKSLSHPYHLLKTTRIGVVNRYKWVSVHTFLLIDMRRTMLARTSILKKK